MNRPGHEQSRDVPDELVRTPSRTDLPESVRYRYLQLADLTPTVSDALDRLDVEGCVVVSGSLSRVAGPSRLVGAATTLRYVAVDGDVAQRRRSGEPARLGDKSALAAARPSDVLVIDAGGDTASAVVGDRVAARLAAGGVAGCLVFGSVRDVESIDATGFPLWASARSPRNALHRLETGEVNGPVEFLGVRIKPGDLVVADANGVVVVPADLVLDVIQICEAIESLEQQSLEQQPSPPTARSN